MANNLTTLSTDIQIFSAEVLMRLRSILGFVKLFPRNTNIGEYAQHGQTLNIPSIAITGGMTERAIGGAATASDVASTSKAVTMKQYYKGVQVDNLIRAITNVDLMPRLANDLAQIVAEGIDGVLYDLWSEIPYQVGEVDGSAAFNSTDKLGVLADARKIATQNKWPRGASRHGILTPSEATALLKLDQVVKVNEAGSAEAVREGRIGRVMGWDLEESNTTDETNTLGTTTNWSADGGTVSGAHAIGATTLAVASLGTGTIPIGSIFKVGTYYYTAKETATITTNAATITLNVPLKEAFSGGEVVTPTVHSAASGIGLLFTPSAFLFVNRPQAPFLPGSGVLEQTITDPESGLTFRLLFESNVGGTSGNAYQEKIWVDILCGAAVLRPELAIRLAGS